jgi:hypothetical protein
MKLKFGLLICLMSLIVSGCDSAGFSGPIAFKQVPVSDSDSSSSTDTEITPPTSGTHSTVETMNLRDKVLMNSTISEIALDNALYFYDDNVDRIKNKNVITVFDITMHSGQARLYVIDTNDGSVKVIHVAHGKNSDKNSDGIATEFSNTNGSLQSSLGFMLTAETYTGKNGYSLKLDGLESRNSNVRSRAVVVHGANYVSSGLSKMGMSYGCPAVSHANRDWLINKIKNGSLLYIYHANHDS